LGIRFEVLPETLQLYRPDGQLFADYLEVQKQLNEVQEQLDDVQEQLGNVQEQLGNVQEQLGNVQEQLDEERQAKEVAEERAKRLEQLLREAGIDTDSGT
jgi:DNA repair ATPase RecN